MNESFLHYVWQMQYFRKEELTTTRGESLTIFKPGTLNAQAGPDFLHARLRIGELEWNGHVEVHLRASDWLVHQHQHDAAYDNVVLHVVWDADRDILRADQTAIPCLALKEKVDDALLLSYRKLANSSAQIPCARSFAAVPEIYKTTMLERAGVERLEQKAEDILAVLAARQQDWEQTAYQLLARNFGFKVNAEPFGRLAEVLPWRILAKYRDNPLQVEALLFGMAGFLENKMTDDYYTRLQTEFQALERLHGLQGHKLPVSMWRFLRLRPANFPTVRLAQFCAWLSGQPGLYGPLVEAAQAGGLIRLFSCCAGSYWHHHYRFGKKARAYSPALGRDSIENIIINTVAPLQAAAGKWYGQQELIERACGLLQQVPAEKNQITRQWQSLNLKAGNAFESQAGIQLYRQYCEQRRCFQCAIGTQLLKPASS